MAKQTNEPREMLRQVLAYRKVAPLLSSVVGPSKFASCSASTGPPNVDPPCRILLPRPRKGLRRCSGLESCCSSAVLQGGLGRVAKAARGPCKIVSVGRKSGKLLLCSSSQIHHLRLYVSTLHDGTHFPKLLNASPRRL